MVEQQSIDDLAERIAQEFEPKQIILFGSHAHGNRAKTQMLTCS